MASRRLSRLVAALVVACALLCLGTPPADADVGGSIPGPGLCEYPGIGGSGASFGEYDYQCAFPVEINGSHWQCLYVGAMYQGTFGVSFPIFNASLTTPVGVLRGACWWACPDAFLSQAEQPNPPGAWKSAIVPRKCKPLGPAPVPIGHPDNPPPEPAIPPGLAPPMPVAPPPPPLPSVSNPIAVDPLGTNNTGDK